MKIRTPLLCEREDEEKKWSPSFSSPINSSLSTSLDRLPDGITSDTWVTLRFMRGRNNTCVAQASSIYCTFSTYTSVPIIPLQEIQLATLYQENSHSMRNWYLLVLDSIKLYLLFFYKNWLRSWMVIKC